MAIVYGNNTQNHKTKKYQSVSKSIPYHDNAIIFNVVTDILKPEQSRLIDFSKLG